MVDAVEREAKIQHSLDILSEAFQRYGMEQIALSFNGGKDCTVLLDLLHKKLKSSLKGLKVIYFQQIDPFPEIDNFVQQCESYYDVKIEFVETLVPMKEILTKICKSDQALKACLMGTRKTDPHCENLKSFELTDKDWPELMRINPLLDWKCSDIWDYILKNNVPYCKLYDVGYTSIGNMRNTEPNPYLKKDNNSTEYRPAYELLNDNLERAGRKK